MASNSDILRVKTYEIDRDACLGRGSYGIVYKAFDTSNNTDICVKQLVHMDIEEGTKEIDNMRRVKNHKHIVQILDDFVKSSCAWIVMEYCPGKTLDNHVKQEDPKLPERITIIFQLTDALHHMHNLSPPVAHRDLKPGNIIINEGPECKLCDYGVSKTLDRIGTVTTSMIRGTLKYMPPELHNRASVMNFKYDALKGDVFSLGLTFLGTLTGEKDKEMDWFFRPGETYHPCLSLSIDLAYFYNKQASHITLPLCTHQ